MGVCGATQVEVRERDLYREWREWHPLAMVETLPHAPVKPVLDERRGTHVALSWGLRRSCPGVNYLFCVEMAYNPFNGAAGLAASDSAGVPPSYPSWYGRQLVGTCMCLRI